MVGLCTFQGLIKTPACNEGLDPGYNGEIVISLRVFSRLDFSTESLNVFKWLRLTLDKAIGFWKQFIFNTNTGDTNLPEFTNQSARIIEVTIAGITIQQNRNTGDIGHKLQLFHHLGPGKLIVVTYSMLCRQGKSGTPYALEARLFHNPCGQTIVSFEDEFRLSGIQHLFQLSGF
jgi:hypothetical protein